ncbi:NAD-dependent epimerase/dehydratase family protein [Paenibacillus sp. MER 99-2]|uniref:NAD-dependent epimerase/dehydratase family protein n=1 Tax=Paenibacillus sp. MER 99-2 TaxID=2939572 RepID=UPI00203B8540|nr:NAD-dependent epimerase/dehydratase family protein [Paenibacillus sp. MER 99-2]MCM3172361.1 NAD-dependent epimerase/dehydratase family protein [Paenibacillus sp. MER 99-2]
MNNRDHTNTAVVAGATGMMGKQLVQLLLEDTAYKRVIVLVRRSVGITHPKLEERIVNFDRLESEVGADILQHADVFCTLGTTMQQAGSKEAFRKVDFEYPLSLAKLALQHHSASYIIVTAMWASEQSWMFYTRVKGELERELLSLGLPRLVILRPSLLTGDREGESLGDRATEVIFRIIDPFLIGPLARMKAIECKKVAKAMIVKACETKPAVEVLESEIIPQVDYARV